MGCPARPLRRWSALVCPLAATGSRAAAVPAAPSARAWSRSVSAAPYPLRVPRRSRPSPLTTSRHEVGTSVELFAGGGGLAMAIHQAGFRHLLTNEFAPRACETLLANKAVLHSEGSGPRSVDDRWPLIQGDIRAIDFSPLAGKVDLLAGALPVNPSASEGWPVVTRMTATASLGFSGRCEKCAPGRSSVKMWRG